MTEGEAAGRIFAQFTSSGGEATGPQIEIPLDLNSKSVSRLTPCVGDGQPHPRALDVSTRT
jgi:hypothetical protein